MGVAKFVYAKGGTEALLDLDLDGFFPGPATGKSVEFVNDAFDSSITLTGKNLQVGDGVVLAGEITGFMFEGGGHTLVTISNFSLDASKLNHVSFTKFFFNLNNKLLGLDGNFVGAGTGDHLYGGGGADSLFGKRGADFLDGGRGNDTLVGGAGSDVFAFAQGYGKDVVKDFDAIGGIDHQDLIGVDFSQVAIKGHGHDTIIDLGGGDTLTLLGVDRRDIDQSDFVQLV
jgi:Ca2+-binding RTX toxin-like protein